MMNKKSYCRIHIYTKPQQFINLQHQLWYFVLWVRANLIFFWNCFTLKPLGPPCILKTPPKL